MEEWNISRYEEHRPSAPLAPFVECTWLLHHNQAGRTRVLPDGCADLIIDDRGYARFVGTMTRAAEVHTEPGQLLSVRFAAGGAAALFGLPMAELADWDGPWAELDTGLRWDSVIEAPTKGSAIRRLERALLSQTNKASQRARRAAYAAVLVARAQTPIATVASELSMSRQQLRRVVVAATGLSPKHLARIGRIRRLIDQLSPCRSLGAEAAVAAGFYDQAHMANEFRELVGTTPRRYLRGLDSAPTS